MKKQYLRGQIYLVKPLATSDKRDTQSYKIRPAIIVSNNIGNTHSKYVSIVYMTGSRRNWSLPTHVTSITEFGTALCEQVYTVSKTRLIGDVKHQCSKDEIKAIDHALAISLGLIDLASNNFVAS